MLWSTDSVRAAALHKLFRYPSSWPMHKVWLLLAPFPRPSAPMLCARVQPRSNFHHWRRHLGRRRNGLVSPHPLRVAAIQKPSRLKLLASAEGDSRLSFAFQRLLVPSSASPMAVAKLLFRTVLIPRERSACTSRPVPGFISPHINLHCLPTAKGVTDWASPSAIIPLHRQQGVPNFANVNPPWELA